MAKAKRTTPTPSTPANTTLPAGQLYRIRMDVPAISENEERRRAAQGAPRKLLPVVVVVDEAGNVHTARAIRALGEVVFAEVDARAYVGGVHALRGSLWHATTRDSIELIND